MFFIVKFLNSFGCRYCDYFLPRYYNLVTNDMKYIAKYTQNKTKNEKWILSLKNMSVKKLCNLDKLDLEKPADTFFFNNFVP